MHRASSKEFLMIHELQSEASVGPYSTREASGRRALEQAELRSWLSQAQQQPGEYVLTTRGVRLLDPAAAQTSVAVRQAMREELRRSIASSVSVRRDSGSSATLQHFTNTMVAMAHECVVFIDAFGIDSEDSLLALARACMDTTQTQHAGGGSTEAARTEMAKIVWVAQSVARGRLRSCKSSAHRSGQ